MYSLFENGLYNYYNEVVYFYSDIAFAISGNRKFDVFNGKSPIHLKIDRNDSLFRTYRGPTYIILYLYPTGGSISSSFSFTIVPLHWNLALGFFQYCKMKLFLSPIKDGERIDINYYKFRYI